MKIDVKIWSNYILTGIILLWFLNKAKGEDNSCNDDKLFLQHELEPYASGWYTKRPMYGICLYVNSNKPHLEYALQGIMDKWALYEYPKNDPLSNRVIYNTNENLSSLFQTELTNYKSKSNYILPHQRGIRLQTISPVLSRFHTNNNENSQERGEPSRDSSDQESSENISETSASSGHLREHNEGHHISEDILKIYPAKKCSCTTLGVQYNETRFREFYRSDTNKNLTSFCNLSNANDQLFENSLLTHSDDDFTLKKSSEWQEEIYLSDNCELIYYNSSEVSWITELSENCSAFFKGIYFMIWSLNSPPCIEHLPPPHQQKWIYYSRLSVLDNPELFDTIHIEDCGGSFKQSICENFSITCTSTT